MTASSDCWVGAQARWTMGPSGRVAGREQLIGSPSSHEPLDGLVRGHCRLTCDPSAEMDAILPCLEYAIRLQQPRSRISSTRCCSCLLGGRGGMAKTSSPTSPNKSSSMAAMPPPREVICSSIIMGMGTGTGRDT